MAILAGTLSTSSSDSIWSVQQSADKAGITKVACNIGIRKLMSKGFAEQRADKDNNGDEYEGVALTKAGWDWIEANENKLILRKGYQLKTFEEIAGDDIPF